MNRHLQLLRLGWVAIILSADAVLIYDPSGKNIWTIEVPAHPTNVCFGGRDAQTLFITTRPALYSIKMRIGGTAKSNCSVSAKP